MAPSRKDPSTTQQYLTPCSPGDENAIEMSWDAIEGDQLLEPDLGLNDFLKAATTTRPTVNKKDLEQQIQFTTEFGQEG